jgi:signal transduction histidine kinase
MGGLPGAELHFTTGEAGEPPIGSGAYQYRHRFAEPYDALAVELRLPPLGDVAGAGTVYALSFLLVAVGAVGLFALYRMVAVAVGFSERRSNFVAAVTHELKTPLTAIRMYGEMLRDGIVPTEEKRAEYYRTITTESERLSRLIDNVLEFSRLEKGTREMNLVVGDLAPVVEEAVEWLRPHAEKEGFGLVVEAAPGLPPVRFDRDALVQVVFNLVDNALKYARDATDKRIRVECCVQDGEVALLVRDSGPGVPARHLSRLFEPFYRGEDELTRRTQGTGIGLALVKGLSERMGGVISGRNADAGGFEVRIGFHPVRADTAPASA